VLSVVAFVENNFREKQKELLQVVPLKLIDLSQENVKVKKNNLK
jgi:hypothetical protein